VPAFCAGRHRRRPGGRGQRPRHPRRCVAVRHRGPGRRDQTDHRRGGLLGDRL